MYRCGVKSLELTRILASRARAARSMSKSDKAFRVAVPIFNRACSRSSANDRPAAMCVVTSGGAPSGGTMRICHGAGSRATAFSRFDAAARSVASKSS